MNSHAVPGILPAYGAALGTEVRAAEEEHSGESHEFLESVPPAPMIPTSCKGVPLRIASRCRVLRDIRMPTLPSTSPPRAAASDRSASER